MENLEKTFNSLRKQPIKELACSRIKTHEALQPRDQSVIPFRDRYRQEAQANEHIARFRQQLSTSTTSQLDPVLVAKVGSSFFLLDGHHRFKAYTLERRERIPTRTLEMPWATAVLTTKLVNLGGVKLPLHKQQASECLWQYLAAMTHRGKLGMPGGKSTRIIGGNFGVSADTVHRMMKRIPSVKLEEYSDAACDEGTQWPQWKYVRGNAQRGMREDLGPELWEKKQIEKCAKQQAKLLDQFEPHIYRRAIELLKQDVEDDRLDALLSISDGPLSGEQMDF